jgi:hypothetical protein
MFLNPKIVRSTFFALGLLVVPLSGQPSRLSEYRIVIPERGEVIACLIAVDTNHYSFLPPPAWQVSCKPGSDSVVMIAPDLGTSITVDFINEPEGDRAAPPAANTASLILDRQSPTNSASYPRAAELLSARYPGARIRETFITLSGLGESLGFDVERKAANGATLVSRVVYAVQDWGNVEFTLTAPTGKFAETTAPFANVINSFHRPAR